MSRIEQVRRNINNGRYDDDEVVDATVENLHAAMMDLAERGHADILAGGQGRDVRDVECDGMALAWVATFGVLFVVGVILYGILIAL